MVRVKDALFYLPEWLARYEELADEIIAVDNGSTDGSYELLLAHPKVVAVLRTEGYHEGRDKNLLYDEMRRRGAEWCLWVDVDEFFEPEFTRETLERMMARPWIRRYAFRRFHFIDPRHFGGSWFRLKYSCRHDRMLWRDAPGGHFMNSVLDSPMVRGIRGPVWYSGYRIKHLGYLNMEFIDAQGNGERRVRWRDRRYSPRVIGLNMLLTLLEARRIPGRIVRRRSQPPITKK